jgi:hypothetical protein
MTSFGNSIEEDNIKHLNRFKFNAPSSSYIAGFIDGDGCLYIRKIKQGYQTGISISQCRTNILQILKYHFGGSITTSMKRNNKTINVMDDDDTYNKYNIRNQYNLMIRSNEYEILLNYLRDAFITKDYKYQCLYKFSKYVDIPNKNEEKELIFNQYLNFKASSLVVDDIYEKRLNIEYIAGLFDAEGCLYINKNNYNKFYISIVQKNNTLLIHKIIQYLGFGNIDEEYRFKIYNKNDCLKFISLIKDLLIVKYNQAIAFIEFLTTDNVIIKDDMYKICNEEKHQIELFTKINKTNEGKDMYNKTLTLRKIKEQICKEIINKQNNREKSLKMKGTGNHNFGKKLTEDTKNKMSNSIKLAKRIISDETIIKVKSLIKDGYKNIDIQNMIDLPRHTITRIKNGRITCINS